MIKVGIVGTGGMANARALNLKKMDDVTIAGISSARPERARHMAEKYRIAYTTNEYEDLLKKDIQAVVLSIPNALHHSYTVKALNAGKHVLVEYPIALTIEEADEMITLAQEKKLILHVGLTDRFEPAHLTIKRNLGLIGPVMAFTGSCWYGGVKYWGQQGWYQQVSMRGDTFSFLHHHEIDQLIDLIGEVSWVDANLYERFVEDGKLQVSSGSLMLGFQNGASAFLTYGQGVIAPHIMSAIIGEDGYMEVEKETLTVKINDDKVRKIPFVVSDSVKIDTDNFIREIKVESQLVYPPQEARETLLVTRKAAQSAKQGRRIYLFS